MTIDEMIEVLQAIKAGDAVQILKLMDRPSHVWSDFTGKNPNFQHYMFRVKPKPMEIYVNVFAGGLGSNHLTKKAAKKALIGYSNGRPVKFIEVIE